MENKGLNTTIENLVEAQQKLLNLYCTGTPEYEKQKQELLNSLGYVKGGGKKINRTYRKKKNGNKIKNTRKKTRS
jgi:hypothetical protein